MYHDKVYLGNWEEVSRIHAADLKGHRVEVRVLDHDPKSSPHRMIFEGMFPELAAVKDSDFKNAEWHGIVSDVI